jgi:hypothetical protein
MNNRKSIFSRKNKRNTSLKIKHHLLSFITLMVACTSINTVYGQSVGISNTAITPDASSILELRTNNKGILIPRMVTTERDGITSPAEGLMIYNTTTNQFNFYNGTTWTALISYANVDLTGEVTSVGNVASLGSFTSLSLNTALTDETGSQLAVFSDSPSFTGIPLAPTAIEGTNTSQLATTAFVLANTDGYKAVDSGIASTTVSTSDELVNGMTLTPGAGTYMVNFNAQCDIPDASLTVGISTATLKLDLDTIVTDIMALTETGPHPLVFGSGETLVPGVYSITGAMSIAGTLTLDGEGDQNAKFIMRGNAAFDTGAGVNVILTNGAKAENVYWIAADAIGLGANTTIQGTILSKTAAIAVGADCIIVGRLLTKGAAITFGPGTISLPTNPSSIDFRSLKSFVVFTGAGGVVNTGASNYTGNIGTDLGAITGFSTATVNGIIYEPGATATVTPIYHKATFSLYKNGVLIPNSQRTLYNSSVVNLQGIATVLAGQSIDVRWKMDTQTSDNGQLDISNRILTLTSVR